MREQKELKEQRIQKPALRKRVLATFMALMLVTSCMQLIVIPSAVTSYALTNNEAGADGSLRLYALPELTWPTTTGLVYGQMLGESALVGGSTEYGSFAWARTNGVPECPGNAYAVIFTPNEQTVTNYGPFDELIEKYIWVEVSPAPAPTIVWPTAEPLDYGKMVGEAGFIGGSTELGSFLWSSAVADIIPPLGTAEYTVDFTPYESTARNYETIYNRQAKVSLTVVQGRPPGLIFPLAMIVEVKEGLKLGDVPLAGGMGDGSFAWRDPSTALKVPGGWYEVVFTPHDPNYEKVFQTVLVTVLSISEEDTGKYDAEYMQSTITVRIGVYGQRWKTLKTYTLADVQALGIYSQTFTWIDNGGFLVQMAAQGVSLRTLLDDAISADSQSGGLGDLTENDVRSIAFHVGDKGGYWVDKRVPDLWGTAMYYYPELAKDWDFRSNQYPFGVGAASEGAQLVEPMICLSEYWHRVKAEEWRDLSNYWPLMTPGARYRLALGMVSPTSRTAHESAKYIDCIDILLNASAVEEGGNYQDYYGHFTEDQEFKSGGSGDGPGDGTDTGTPGTGDGGKGGDGDKPGGGGEGNSGTGEKPGTGSGDGDDGKGSQQSPGDGGDKGNNGSPDGTTTSNTNPNGDVSGTRVNENATGQNSNDKQVVELTLSDGTTVKAVEISPTDLVPLGMAPNYSATLLSGSDLLRSTSLSALELVGDGNGGGDAGGRTARVGQTDSPLVLSPIDTFFLFVLTSFLAASFVSGGITAFLKGWTGKAGLFMLERLAIKKGAVFWTSLR